MSDDITTKALAIADAKCDCDGWPPGDSDCDACKVRSCAWDEGGVVRALVEEVERLRSEARRHVCGVIDGNYIEDLHLAVGEVLAIAYNLACEPQHADIRAQLDRWRNSVR